MSAAVIMPTLAALMAFGFSFVFGAAPVAFSSDWWLMRSAAGLLFVIGLLCMYEAGYNWR